jgi:hypothetical protein
MASASNQGFAGGQRPNRADEGTLGGAASAVRDKVEDVASSVASTAEGAWDSTRQAASAVANTAGDAWGELTGLMRRYPFATFFLGVGCGVVLYRLMEDRAARDLRDLARWGSSAYDRAREYASNLTS